MYFDRWDILEAYVTFCSDWHSGQSSELYEKLCRANRLIKLSPLHRGYESLSDNGKEIYDNLVERYGFTEQNEKLLLTTAS
jgi:predicted RNA-binding protein (virulence factor B family)